MLEMIQLIPKDCNLYLIIIYFIIKLNKLHPKV